MLILLLIIIIEYYYLPVLTCFAKRKKPLTSDQGQVCGRTFNMDRIAKHQAGPFFWIPSDVRESGSFTRKAGFNQQNWGFHHQTIEFFDANETWRFFTDR